MQGHQPGLDFMEPPGIILRCTVVPIRLHTAWGSALQSIRGRCTIRLRYSCPLDHTDIDHTSITVGGKDHTVTIAVRVKKHVRQISSIPSLCSVPLNAFLSMTPIPLAESLRTDREQIRVGVRNPMNDFCPGFLCKHRHRNRRPIIHGDFG